MIHYDITINNISELILFVLEFFAIHIAIFKTLDGHILEKSYYYFESNL